MDRCFVLERFFPRLDSMASGTYTIGEAEKHLGVWWRIRAIKNTGRTKFQLECMKSSQTLEWSIDANIEVKKIDGEKILKTESHLFSNDTKAFQILQSIRFIGQEDYLDKMNFKTQITVRINQMTGIETILKSFNQNHFSDVVLVVENQKFHVLKAYLASHSSFFDRLFFEKFEESNKSEVKLEGIDPYTFQKFLEVIYGEPAENDDNVEDIIELADYFESKTAVRRCEDFLLKSSVKPVHMRLETATKYNLKALKEKCRVEMQAGNKVRLGFPENVVEHEQSELDEFISKLKF